MAINRTQLKKILQLGANPGVGLFQAVQQMETEMSSKVAKLKEEIIKEVLKEIKETDPQNAGFIDKIVNKTVSQLVKDTKGDQGIQGIQGLQGNVGVTGQSITGKQGLQGITGLQGAIGKEGKDGKDGKSGIDGKTPLLGIDFLTKEDIDNFVEKIVSRIKLKPLEQKINELIRKINTLERTQQFSGKKTGVSKFGPTLVFGEVPTGSGTTFTLANMPELDSEMLYVNGMRQLRGVSNDYTISGLTITLNSGLESDDNFLADYQLKPN